MQHGGVVTVAAAGDYGKPRPAVIVQTDGLPENHASVVICKDQERKTVRFGCGGVAGSPFDPRRPEIFAL